MTEPLSGVRPPDEALPRSLVVAVLALTPVPFVLDALGFAIDPGRSAGLVHSLLEWTSVCIALCTFGLGILAWIARPDPLLLIISLASLLAGISDSVHTMTTSGLLGFTGRFEDFVLWSGAIGRLLWALALTVGAVYLLCFHRENRMLSWKRLATFALFAAVGTVALQLSSILGNIPPPMLPGAVARRSWDLPLLVLILISGFIYLPVMRRRPSLLPKSLLLANVPLATVGFHYILGYTALYDGSFFSAHVLKVLSALVPLTAVSLHLVRSYRREVEAVESMRKLVRSLEMAEDELRSKEVRLNQLTQNIKEVFWITTPDASRMHYVSPAYKDIFGLTEESLYHDPLSFLEVLHPDDRQSMVDLIAQGGKSDFELDYRILRPDGEARWLRTRGFPIRNEQGEVYRLAGVTEDVTGRKRAESELETRPAPEPF
jgi:PAS domain S-box-containing protein